MTKPTLGFAGLANLSSIKPETEPPPSVSEEKIDKAAERAGFVSREPVKRVQRPPSSGITTNLSFRPTVEAFNRFATFAMDRRMTYAEALTYLMDAAGLDEQGAESDGQSGQTKRKR